MMKRISLNKYETEDRIDRRWDLFINGNRYVAVEVLILTLIVSFTVGIVIGAVVS